MRKIFVLTVHYHVPAKDITGARCKLAKSIRILKASKIQKRQIKYQGMYNA